MTDENVSIPRKTVEGWVKTLKKAIEECEVKK